MPQSCCSPGGGAGGPEVDFEWARSLSHGGRSADVVSSDKDTEATPRCRRLLRQQQSWLKKHGNGGRGLVFEDLLER